LTPARRTAEPSARRLAKHRGQLGRLAGEQLTELVSQLLVAGAEVAQDLRGDRVALRAQREQDVLGRSDRAAMAEPTGLDARRFEDALRARRDAERRGLARVPVADDPADALRDLVGADAETLQRRPGQPLSAVSASSRCSVPR
jgi:hypothetical protein